MTGGLGDSNRCRIRRRLKKLRQKGEKKRTKEDLPPPPKQNLTERRYGGAKARLGRGKRQGHKVTHSVHSSSLAHHPSHYSTYSEP